MIQIDENFTSIILAIISLISLFYTKTLDVVDKKKSDTLQAKSVFFKKEKELREAIQKQKEEMDRIRSTILISVLHSNTSMLKYATEDAEKRVLENEAAELEAAYTEAAENLKKLKERYALLLDIAGNSVEETK